MAQKGPKGVTKDRAKYRCPKTLERLIDLVNEIDGLANELPEMFTENSYDWYYNNFRGLCKGIHQLAQIASLPDDLCEDYAKALTGTAEDWERFQERLPAKLWRKWPEMDTDFWTWPRITISLMIGQDGRVSAPDEMIATALVGIEARRLKECRRCRQIFWASRIDKSGGPFGCSPECNNALRQRDFKARKKP